MAKARTPARGMRYIVVDLYVVFANSPLCQDLHRFSKVNRPTSGIGKTQPDVLGLVGHGDGEDLRDEGHLPLGFRQAGGSTADGVVVRWVPS